MYEIIILLLTVIGLFYAYVSAPKLLKRYGLIALAVFLFDFSTQIAWLTHNLHGFTFMGPQLNWIMTLTWTNLLFYGMLIIDTFCKVKESMKFFKYVIFIGIVGLFVEGLLIHLGIRDYGPEVKAILTGIKIPWLAVPIEAIYYLPVFLALAVGFIRYFEEYHIKGYHEAAKRSKK